MSVSFLSQPCHPDVPGEQVRPWQYPVSEGPSGESCRRPNALLRHRHTLQGRVRVPGKGRFKNISCLLFCFLLVAIIHIYLNETKVYKKKMGAFNWRTILIINVININYVIQNISKQFYCIETSNFGVKNFFVFLS